MEVRSTKCTVVDSNVAPTVGANLLTTEAVPVVTLSEVPYLSNEAPVDVTVQGNAPQYVNVFQDGTVTGGNGQPSYILATNADGSAILVDASQWALLTQQTFPIYEGTKVLQVTADSASAGGNSAETSEKVERALDGSQVNGDTRKAPPVPSSSKKIPAGTDSEVQPPIRKGPYKCSRCNREYLKHEQLERHLKKHADEKPYKCEECNASFNIELNLQLHKATHSSSELACLICKRKFSRVASFRAHLMLHEEDESLTCPDCNEEFSSHVKFEKHICGSENKEEEELAFACKKCGRSFAKLGSLKEHMRLHYKLKLSLSHKTYKKDIDRSDFPHKCFTCGKQFKKPSQLIRHVRIHTGEKPFKCSVCSRAFNQKGALQIHMTKHSGVRPHRCDFCPATFSQRGNLRAHVQRVHMLPQGNDVVHQCTQCSCSFKKLGSLHAHMRRSHSDISIPSSLENGQQDGNDSSDLNKQVDEVLSQLMSIDRQESTNCKEQEIQKARKTGERNKENADILQQALENSGLASNQEEEKILDMKKQIPNKAVVMTVTDTATGKVNKHFVRKVGNIRWYQCIYCSKEFKKPSDLVRHIRIHTHEKPYKCDMCFRAFAVKSTLTAHLRTHIGIKEFKCQACDKMFSSSGSLRVHYLLHTGAKPYGCSFCGKQFRTSGHRRSHMISHQKENSGKKPRKVSRSGKSNNVNMTDFALPEPILITDAGFVQPLSRNDSSFTAEETTADRPYKCNVCSRGFKKSSHLKQHVRSHSGEKPFECNICHRFFVSNGVLKAHVKTHSGVKAHKCDLCEASFTTRGSLKRHFLIHTDERPFMCPYCQKTFKTTMACRKHMLSHRYELAQGGAAGMTVTVVSDAPHSGEEGEPQGHVVPNVVEQVAEGLIATDQSRVAVEGVANQQPLTVEQEVLMISNQSYQQQHKQPVQQVVVISQENGVDQSQFRDVAEKDLLSDADRSQKKMLETEKQTSNHSQASILHQSLGQLSSNAYEETHFPMQVEPLITLSETSYAVSTTSVVAECQLSSSLHTVTQSPGVVVSASLPPNNTEQAEKSVKMLESQQKRGKKIYKCSECDHVCKNSSHLAQHICTHTVEKPFMCIPCGRMFNSKSALQGHMKTHDGRRDYICNTCSASFTTKGSLTRHMALHASKRIYQCPYCGVTFDVKVLYKEHFKQCEKQHQPVETPEQENGELTEVTSMRKSRPPPIRIPEEQTEQLARQNPEDTDSVSEKVLIASAAEKDRISEIKDKSTDQENWPKYRHACERCPKSFKKPSDLTRHVRIHTGEKPYACDSCGKRFTVKSTLDSHIKTHSGEKNFSCHVCCSHFATKGSLKVHMRLHTGARPFKCPYCELKFRTSGHRKSHIASHFKSNTMKRRKLVNRLTDQLSSSLDIENASEPQTSSTSQPVQASSLTTTQAAQALEAPPPQPPPTENVQVQLASGIQIATLDPNFLSKLVPPMDGGTLQQPVSITLNPNILMGQINGSVSDVVVGDGIGENSLQNQAIEVPVSSGILGTGMITLNPNIIFQQVGITVNPKTAQPEALLTANAGAGINYSVICSNPNDVAALAAATSSATDVSQPVVQGEGMEEGSFVIDSALTQAAQVTDLQVINLVGTNTVQDHDGLVTQDSVGKEPKHDIIWSCRDCERFFDDKNELLSHVESHRKTKRPKNNSHMCERCNVPFAYKRTLQAHMKQVHRES